MPTEDKSALSERSNRFFLLLIVWIARHLGRPFTRVVLRIVVFYYVLAAPGARKSSRDFLRRVLPETPRLRDIFRHFFAFASVILDRVYVLSSGTAKLQVEAHDQRILHQHRDANTGAIVMMSHLGSFEVMRALGYGRYGLRLRVLMDHAAGAKANAVLDAINPTISDTLIDTSESDVDRVLKLKASLEDGEIISLMADRHRPGERVVSCEFLGEAADFPVSPWILAGMLKVPVVICFGLYRGGNRYDLYFEEFAPQLDMPRAKRLEKAHEYAQMYADRLAHYTRQAPYNWFNFYDFWQP